MFDFNEIFKIQLAESSPLTKGSINSILSLMSFNLTPKEIMRESKALKEKIGEIRLMYFVVDRNHDGSPKKPKMLKTWGNEFTQLQMDLDGYNHTGFDGQIPVFTHKDVV